MVAGIAAILTLVTASVVIFIVQAANRRRHRSGAGTDGGVVWMGDSGSGGDSGCDNGSGGDGGGCDGGGGDGGGGGGD